MLAPHMDRSIVERYIAASAKSHQDIAQVAYDYFSKRKWESMDLSTHMLAQHSLCYYLFCTDTSDALKSSLWRLSIDYALGYMQRIYTEEMLSAQNQWVLTPLERFIVLGAEAKQLMEDNLQPEALKLLRQAVKIYPQAKEVVGILLAEIESRLAVKKPQEELAELAALVKSQIRQLLAEMRQAEASNLLDQLAAIVPEDEEVKQLMGELTAAHAVWN